MNDQAISDQQRQHLSALVDEEIDPALVQATVSALDSNADLKAAWERYHLIGAAIRSEPLREEYRKIAAQVKARIADEPLPLGRSKPGLARDRGARSGRVASVVLAASIAFATVFGLPRLFTAHTEGAAIYPYGGQVAANAPLPSRSVETDVLDLGPRRPGQRWHLDEPALETKLDRFLVTHREQSPASDMKGFFLYATVVGYEAGR